MTKKDGNKLIKGAAILGIAGVIVKAIGAIFRIPLTNWIGDTGMSYYGVAYTVYGVLLVLATSGMPVAISRMVAERIALGQYKNAHRVFKMSITIMFFIGLFSFSVCFFGGGIIARMVGNPEAALALKAISPALLIVPVLSACRGYFQGRQNMNPTAISEVTEQTVRAIVGLALAYTFVSVGLEESAAGAAFGASAGSLAGLIIMAIIYMLNRKTIHKKIELHDPETESNKELIKKIVFIAIPIIIGAEIMPIMSLVDTGIIMNRLQATGWTMSEAKSMYGLFSGFINPLIALPQIFTGAVAVSLVPAVAGRFRVEDNLGVQQNISLGMRTTMIMAFPCAIGIFALAKPILFLLYFEQKSSAAMAVPTLMLMSLEVIFLAISQTSTGILQAIGKQTLPVKNLALGVFFKVFVTYFLVGIRPIHINGAAIGTGVAYIIALSLNMRDVRRYTNAKIDKNLTYFRPLISASFMGIVAYGTHWLINGVLGNTIATFLAIVAGGIVYVSLIFLLKAVTLEEVENMPGMSKISKIIDKISFIK